MTTHTLLLNGSYEPMGVIPWQRAMTLMLGDKVVVLESYDSECRSVGVCFKIPAVICLKRYVKVRPKVKFSRKNLYMRDNFTCQYCGVHANKLKYRVQDLNLDHVVPRSRGGKTSWENIVCSCLVCNTQKANRTPEQAGMRILRKPIAPKFLSMLSISLTDGPFTPKEWQSYLYWECELEKDV